MILPTSSIDLASMAQDEYPARGRAPRSSSMETIREPQRGRGVAGHGVAEESSGRTFSVISPRSATDSNSNADASGSNDHLFYVHITDAQYEFPKMALSSTVATGSGSNSALTPQLSYTSEPLFYEDTSDAACEVPALALSPTTTTGSGTTSASRHQLSYLKSLYQHSLRGHVTFVGNRDPSIIEGFAICNRRVHTSPLDDASRHHVWAACLYLITTEPSRAPSASSTFLEMVWKIWDDENAAPREHHAAYRGNMTGRTVSDIPSQTGWRKCSERTWALDFAIAIPRGHWTHSGRSKCSLIASVAMGSATATHVSTSGGDRASATHLHHKLPPTSLAV